MHTDSLRISKIKNLLTEAFNPLTLEIIDDSHQHIGHAGAQNGAGHYRITIVSQSFAGLKMLARHQLVYNALADLMKAEIHALSIKTLTIEEQ